METFRIAAKKHSGTLSASGKANRWNKDGENVLYVGSSRSLSTLELVVHRSSIKPTIEYKVMIISIAVAENLYGEIHIKDLPSEWRKSMAYPQLQNIGSDWYNSKRSLFLKVPSAIITQEFNYLVNLEHPDFTDNNISLRRNEDYFWDDRLF